MSTRLPARKRLANYLPMPGPPSTNIGNSLQSVAEELVHLRNLGRHGEVDCAVANLDDKSANDIGVDLVGQLDLLSLADVLRLRDSGLQAGQGAAVQLLRVTVLVPISPKS